MTDKHDPADETPAENPYEPFDANADSESEAGYRPSASRFKAGPFIIVAVLVTVFALIQVQRKILNRADRHESDEISQSSTEDAVGLTVQWDNQRRLPLFEVPWSPGITVRDVMLAAQKADVLTFDEAGEDDAAMLTSISGIENEGGGTDSFNWTYQVNGVLANKSFAIYQLEKGDIVSWKFGPYE